MPFSLLDKLKLRTRSETRVFGDYNGSVSKRNILDSNTRKYIYKSANWLILYTRLMEDDEVKRLVDYIISIYEQYKISDGQNNVRANELAEEYINRYEKLREAGHESLTGILGYNFKENKEWVFLPLKTQF